MTVPAEVVSAINLLLAPYGEKYVPADEGTDKLLDYKEACALLGISHGTLRKHVLSGRVACLKMGENNCK